MAARRIRELAQEARSPAPERFVVAATDPLVLEGLDTDVRLEDGDDDLDAGAVSGVRLSSGDVLYVQPETAGDGLEWTVIGLNAGVIPNATAEDIASLQGQIDLLVGGGGDKHYVHTQPSPAAVWHIAHNLGKKPSIHVFDTTDTERIVDIHHVDLNNATATWNGAALGYATCD